MAGLIIIHLVTVSGFISLKVQYKHFDQSDYVAAGALQLRLSGPAISE